MPELSASILAADLLNLEREIERAIESGVKWLHLDVMDGHFVPNLTFGIPVGSAIRKKFKTNVESHLMIENPDINLDKYCSFSNIVTIHYEAPVQTARVLRKVGELGSLPGIAIRPKTQAFKIEGLLPEVKFVLVMTVEPGFSGQEMIESALSKIELLRGYREKKNLDFLIGVDGGVNRKNISKVAGFGPDIIVSASAIFNGDIEENIKSLTNSIKGASNERRDH